MEEQINVFLCRLVDKNSPVSSIFPQIFVFNFVTSSFLSSNLFQYLVVTVTNFST